MDNKLLGQQLCLLLSVVLYNVETNISFNDANVRRNPSVLFPVGILGENGSFEKVALKLKLEIFKEMIMKFLRIFLFLTVRFRRIIFQYFSVIFGE